MRIPTKQRDYHDVLEEETISTFVDWGEPGLEAISRPERIDTEDSGAEKRSPPPDGSLWDSFWSNHGSNGTLFDTLLWGVRYAFSWRHARLLTRKSVRAESSSNTQSRFIEIGCGSATTSRFICKSSGDRHGVGIDLSLEAIRVAQQRNPELLCVVADALALPFVGDAFAIAFSSGVIEHFSRKEASAMFDEHCRVTKRNGVAAVIVPWKHSLYNLLRIVVGERWPFGYEDPFGANELRRFVSSNGLHKVRVHITFGTTLLAKGIKYGSSNSRKYD